MRPAVFLALVALCLAAALRSRGADITWRLDTLSADVTAHQFGSFRAGPGGVRGPVVWDPYLYLRVPDAGIDADRFRWLEVRLYSSAPADALEVYYQAPNGDWALLTAYPVRRGWATYRADLSRLAASERGGSESAGRWGAAERRVVSLRLDPGNQANRWVAVSRVRLTDEPLVEGVVDEPRGALKSVRVQAAANVEAGSPVRAGATFELMPGAPAHCTAYLRLMRGAMVLAEHEALIDGRKPSTTVSARFPTSRHLPSGSLRVVAGAYELDDPASGTAHADLRLRNTREGKVQPPRAEVRRVGGDPAIVVNGKPLAGMAYLTGAGLQLDFHREFARAGIHLYTDWFGTSDAGNLGHAAEGRYDYGAFDSYFADILDADPDALFLPHVYVTPPAWWREKHPEEMVRFSDGTANLQSFASERWRREMGEDLRRLVLHLQSTSYADRILGYILCSGHTAEWQQWGVWENKLADYSEPARQGFAKWLERQGRGADAATPTAEQRRESRAFLLRDPAREQNVIDFTRYLSETIASAIAHFARVAKEASGGRSLVGAYYGYLTQHGPYQQDSGHLALAKLLESGDLDFVMSPPMYTGREVGGTSTVMSAAASVRLRGKLWLNESDIRTSLSHPGAGYGRADTLPQSRALLLREFGAALANRTAISWFDMYGGWFSNPAILQDMAAMRKLADQALAARRPVQREMAVFISAESAYRMKPSLLYQSMVLLPVVDLPRVGVPADVYLLSDIDRADFPRYRVYVFLNAAYVDAATRRSIKAKLKRDRATAVWVFAAGAVTDAGISAESVRELTGIRVAVEMGEAVQQVRPVTPAGAGGLPAFAPAGPEQPYGPVLWVDDPEAEVLGVMSGSGKPGLVRKRVDGWTSIYCAGLSLPPAAVRAFAREAGAHVYLDTDDAIDTDGQWACIHARTAGEKVLRLPAARRVQDAMTGRVVAAEAKSVTLRMKAGETLLLRLIPPRGAARRQSR